MNPFYDPRMPTPIYATSHTLRAPTGSQTGSQRSQVLSDTGRRPATVSAANWLFRRRRATSRDGTAWTYKRGVTGSNPVAPTSWLADLRKHFIVKLNSSTKALLHGPPGFVPVGGRRVRGRAVPGVNARQGRGLGAQRPRRLTGGRAAPPRPRGGAPGRGRVR
jgi:hypothetical protein